MLQRGAASCARTIARGVLTIVALFPIDCASPPSVDDAPDGVGCVPKLPTLKMVPIAAGAFTMGSPSSEWHRGLYDEDQVQVTLTHNIEMSQYETTQAQWAALCLDDPSSLDLRDRDGAGSGDCSDPQCPVGTLTWYDALEFTNRLSTLAGYDPCYVLEGCSGSIGHALHCASASASSASIYACTGYRLPTEAEWEYSARAGTTTAFYDGDIAQLADGCGADPNLAAIGWYCGDSDWITKPVGQKAPNAWGLYDMLGNALEWVNDAFTGAGYGVGPLIDPNGVLVIGDGVARGGAAYGQNDVARCAARIDSPRAATLSDGGGHAVPGYGFRIVRTVQ